jgi:hypothetical protein
MSDYYLADLKAEERERQRRAAAEPKRETAREPKESQNMKVTLLGDFLFPSNEPRGCDPYNATHGKSPREAWKAQRERR